MFLRMVGVALTVGLLLCGLGLGQPNSGQKSVAITKLETLTAGVTLPVALTRTLEAGKTPVGMRLKLKTTQRVPVGAGTYMNYGAVVEGEVVMSEAGDGSTTRPSVLAVRLTLLRYKGQTLPVSTRAIAIANMTDVSDTLMPANGSTDRGNSNQASWTTRQVGGDEVYRSGWFGPVCDGQMRTVGQADYFGVYSLPGAGALPRAMGVFSTTAGGLYGFDEGAVLQSSQGTITVSEPGRKLVLRNGDNLLLEVE